MKRIYGLDKLSWFLLLLTGICTATAVVFALKHVSVCYWIFFCLSVLFLMIVCFRICSRNHAARRHELTIYERVIVKLAAALSPDKEYLAEMRKYKFYACPQCSQRLRVPRGKGRIRITCIRCGNKFIKKT